MKRMMGGLLAVMTVAAFGAVDLDGQQGRRGADRGFARNGGPDGPGPGIERIMNLKEELELTEDQLEALDGVRRQSVSYRTGVRTRMAELQSELDAGLIKRSDLMAAMEDFREAGDEISTQHRGQIEGILNEAQMEKLGELRRDGRRGARRGGQQVRGNRRGGGGAGIGARDARGPRNSGAVGSNRNRRFDGAARGNRRWGVGR